MPSCSLFLHLIHPFTIFRNGPEGIASKTDIGTEHRVAALFAGAASFAVVSGSIALLVFFGPMHFSALGTLSYLLAVPSGFVIGVVAFYAAASLTGSRRPPESFIPPEETIPSSGERTLDENRSSSSEGQSPPQVSARPEEIIPSSRESDLSENILSSRELLLKTLPVNLFNFFEKKAIQIMSGMSFYGDLNSSETRKKLCCLLALEIICSSEVKTDACDVDKRFSYLLIKEGEKEIAKLRDAELNPMLDGEFSDGSPIYLNDLLTSPNIPTFSVKVKQMIVEGGFSTEGLKQNLLDGPRGAAEKKIFDGIEVIASQINRKYLSHISFSLVNRAVVAVFNVPYPLARSEDHPYREAKNIYEVFAIATQRIAQDLITKKGLQESVDFGIPEQFIYKQTAFQALIFIDILTHSQIIERRKIGLSPYVNIDFEPLHISSKEGNSNLFANELTHQEGEKDCAQFFRSVDLFKKLSNQEITKLKDRYISQVAGVESDLESKDCQDFIQTIELLVSFYTDYFTCAQIAVGGLGVLSYPVEARGADGKQEVIESKSDNVEILRPIPAVNINFSMLQKVGIEPSALQDYLEERGVKQDFSTSSTLENLDKIRFTNKLEGQFNIPYMLIVGFDLSSCLFSSMCNLIFKKVHLGTQVPQLRALASQYLRENVEHFLDSPEFEFLPEKEGHSFTVDRKGVITLYVSDKNNVERVNPLKREAIKKYAAMLIAPEEKSSPLAYGNQLVLDAFCKIFDRPAHIYLSNYESKLTHSQPYRIKDEKLCPQSILNENLPGIPFSLHLREGIHYYALKKQLVHPVNKS